MATQAGCVWLKKSPDCEVSGGESASPISQKWDPEETDWVCVAHMTRCTGDHRSQRAGAPSPGSSIVSLTSGSNDYTTLVLYKHLERHWGKKETYFKKINGLRFRSKSQNDLFVLNLLQEEGCSENLRALLGPCWLSARRQAAWAVEPGLG